MKAISGGLNVGSEFNPEKLCSEMKGTSGGLNRDVGPSPTPKRGKKNIAGSFRTQTPIQFLRGSFSKWFLSGSVPRGSRIPVRIDS